MAAADLLAPVEVHVGGKINLFLLITGRRPNGYHELATLFMPLPGPCDILAFAPAPGGSGIRVACDSAAVDPDKNTLTRAYSLYAEATGFAPAVSVRLRKGIPSGAGLGGGSADGAAVLAFLQRHCPHPLAEPQLCALAAKVGADVPFFLRGGPCIAEGIGEILRPAPSGLDGWSCVLVCPPVHVDTAWAYAAWDAERKPFSLTEWEKIAKNIPSHYQCLYGRNDFEPVVFARWPELSAWKAGLRNAGADIAGMSGSGSSMYGLFRNSASAVSAAASLRGMGADVFGPFLF